jgi:hypothetical protein
MLQRFMKKSILQLVDDSVVSAPFCVHPPPLDGQKHPHRIYSLIEEIRSGEISPYFAPMSAGN